MVHDATVYELIKANRLVVDADQGMVFSKTNPNPLKPLGALTRKGYVRTSLKICGRLKSVMVHRIVCIAATGLPPEGKPFVNHINGDKTDNRACNLEWVSHVDNMLHSRKLGTHAGVGRRDGIRDNKGRFGRKSPPTGATR